jgi:hypothetical protein
MESGNFNCLQTGILIVADQPWLERTPRILQHTFVTLSFLLGWVIFRTEDISQIGGWLNSMVGGYGWGHPMTLNALNVLHLYPWFLVAILASTPAVGPSFRKLRGTPVGGFLADLSTGIMLFWSVVEIILGRVAPFIYFQF